MGSMLPYTAASWILWVMNIAPMAGENFSSAEGWPKVQRPGEAVLGIWRFPFVMEVYQVPPRIQLSWMTIQLSWWRLGYPHDIPWLRKPPPRSTPGTYPSVQQPWWTLVMIFNVRWNGKIIDFWDPAAPHVFQRMVHHSPQNGWYLPTLLCSYFLRHQFFQPSKKLSRNVAGPSPSKQSKGKKSVVLQELIQETKEKNASMISAPRKKFHVGGAGNLCFPWGR